MALGQLQVLRAFNGTASVDAFWKYLIDWIAGVGNYCGAGEQCSGLVATMFRVSLASALSRVTVRSRNTISRTSLLKRANVGFVCTSSARINSIGCGGLDLHPAARSTNFAGWRFRQASAVRRF